MKKTVLALTLLLSACGLTACGNPFSSSSSSSSASSSSAVKESASASEAAAELELGTISGQTYSSSFSGLMMTVPDSWNYSDEDELLAMMNLTGDADNAEALKKDLVEQITIYDAMANDPETGTNIIVMYENLAKEVPDPDAVTIKDYLVSFKLQLTSGSSSTYTETAEQTEVSFGNLTYTKLMYQIKDPTTGNTYYQGYYIRKIGKYMSCIITTGASETELNALESYFSAG